MVRPTNFSVGKWEGFIELLGVMQVKVGESGQDLLALALTVILVLQPCEIQVGAITRHLVNFGDFSFFCNCYLLFSCLSLFYKLLILYDNM